MINDYEVYQKLNDFRVKNMILGKKIAQTRVVQERNIADSSTDWMEAVDGTGKR